MKNLFIPTCDRYGHLLTGLGGSPQVMALFIFPTPEEMAFSPVTAGNGFAPSRNGRPNQAQSKKGKNRFEIRKILVPVDSEHAKPADLNYVIQLARRLRAEVTLLHCYETPPSFSYAKGHCACNDVIRHQELTQAHLQKLCSRIRKSWSKCLWIFEVGPLPASILRVSKRIRADLIVVPARLDSASETWSPNEVLDELVRKANCPVLAGGAITSAPLPDGAGGKATRG
jgi:nucleotide-binding universal stress UspA family protein